MSKNTQEIPFTEIVERAAELTRTREDVSRKIRGVINDIYVRDITRKEDWAFLIARSTLTFTAQFSDGNITATTGGTTVSFPSTVSIDSSMNGRRLSIVGNDFVYNFTMQSGTGGSIQPPLSGTQNVANQSYSIFQPYYSLAADFDRFPKNGGLHQYFGGQVKIIQEKDYRYFTENMISTPNDTIQMCRLVGTDTAGNRLVEVNPPPKTATSAEYDYLKKLRPMRETTAGLIGNISSGGVNVIGDSGTQFTVANTGDFLRIDALGKGADSEWYRIIAISGNSGLTLATAFGLTGITSANYTICSSPDMPVMMHPAVLYGAIVALAADQNDAMIVGYKQEYANVLSDGKRIYKTRVYSQEIDTIATDYNYRR